jgi:hemoglobin-like flavoprotein
MKDQLHQLAHSIYAPMFAERGDLREAFTYAHELAKASDNSAAVLTAVHVVANTIAKEIESIKPKAKEDRHIQFQLGGKDYDLVLRADDDGQDFVSFDIFDYEAQEYKTGARL